jgi:phage terminase large subunit
VARTVEIPLPEVFEPLLQPSRYKGLYGGRGGAKSHALGDLLIDECIRHRGLRFVCIREVQRTLGQSVKLLIEDKLRTYNLGEREGFRVLNNEIQTPGNGLVIFIGMQNHTADSIKSLEGFDRAWVEEAQTLSQRSLDLLRPTMFRKPGTEIWCSWNPRFPTDPVDDFFRGNAEHKGAWSPPPDSVLVRSSYRDNPYVMPDLLKEIEWDKRRDPDKYAHVWMGEYEKHSESRVFKNWTIDEFDSPTDAVYYYGADWGYSIDPSTLVRCRLDGRKLYVDYEAYRIGVEIDHLPQLFDVVPGARVWPIIADSARPETISYLQRNGFPRIKSATKGKDSVKEGVIFLQNYDIIVHPRCTHMIDELTMYSYKVDKLTGMVTPILEDKKNHMIDSLRYAVEQLRQPVMQMITLAGFGA